MNIHDYGFYRLAAVVPSCTVGDCARNAGQIIRLLRKSAEMGADIAVFPALTVTSASCGDLFRQRVLLNAAEKQLVSIVKQTAADPVIGIVGFPFFFQDRYTAPLPSLAAVSFTALCPLTVLRSPGCFRCTAAAEPRRTLPDCRVNSFRSVPI